LANIGNLEVRTGHLAEAESTLKGAIEHERALAGDSAAVASAVAYYGRLLSLTNRSAEAVPTLKQAVALGAQYTGPSSPLTVQSRLYLGEAQIATGDNAAARVTLTENDQKALAQYGPQHPLTLRNQLALAKLLIAEGNGPAARAQLTAIIPGLRQAGAQTVEELTEALRLQRQN
jgi:hypothetical protein